MEFVIAKQLRSNLIFRPATVLDLPAIVQMLADDDIGSTREDPSIPLCRSYLEAFEAIEADPNNELIVTLNGEQIVGVLQLTFVPYLTYIGGWRALIEGVRVSKDSRSGGIGGKMLRWAINRAKERNCVMVQLTTDKLRPEALRFYENLGFVASHEGLKLRF